MIKLIILMYLENRLQIWTKFLDSDKNYSKKKMLKNHLWDNKVKRKEIKILLYSNPLGLSQAVNIIIYLIVHRNNNKRMKLIK